MCLNKGYDDDDDDDDDHYDDDDLANLPASKHTFPWNGYWACTLNSCQSEKKVEIQHKS